MELRNPQRQLIMQGRMKRKENTTSESSDLQVLLFDHYLVFAKIKYHDHLEYYRVNRQVKKKSIYIYIVLLIPSLYCIVFYCIVFYPILIAHPIGIINYYNK